MEKIFWSSQSYFRKELLALCSQIQTWKFSFSWFLLLFFLSVLKSSFSCCLFGKNKMSSRVNFLAWMCLISSLHQKQPKGQMLINEGTLAQHTLLWGNTISKPCRGEGEKEAMHADTSVSENRFPNGMDFSETVTLVCPSVQQFKNR